MTKAKPKPEEVEPPEEVAPPAGTILYFKQKETANGPRDSA